MEGKCGAQRAGAKQRGCFLAQAVFGTAFAYLTSGVCLSGLAIWMGAGDVLVSYLSVILNLCGVLTLAFAAFLERFRSRKRLAIGLTVLSRLATLGIAAIPVLAPGSCGWPCLFRRCCLHLPCRPRPLWC